MVPVRVVFFCEWVRVIFMSGVRERPGNASNRTTGALTHPARKACPTNINGALTQLTHSYNLQISLPW